jgi:hypothetical protein
MVANGRSGATKPPSEFTPSGMEEIERAIKRSRILE